MMQAKSRIAEKKVVEQKKVWRLVLVVGLGLYALGMGIVSLTGNWSLFATAVALGTLTAPTAVVVFVFERRLAREQPVAEPVVAQRARTARRRRR